jgi:hypothetical protein
MRWLFQARALAVRKISSAQLRLGKPELGALSDDRCLHVPPNAVRKIKKIGVMQVDAQIAMRFLQVFDELPPRVQTLAKVLNLATRRCGFKVPRYIV